MVYLFITDREQNWDFSSNMFYLKCKMINQKAIMNGDDNINTSDKVGIEKNGKISYIPM